MAGARCAAVSSLIPSISPNARRRTKQLVLVSASLRKPTQRKNYLRPKILKTLPKPPSNPVIPIVCPESEPNLDSESLNEEISGEICAADAREADKVEEFRVSETSVEYDGTASKFSARSVQRYGAYLLGIFVFQTFCAVWVLGNANSERKERNSDNSDVSTCENSKEKFVLSKNGIGSVQDDMLVRKIEEIRLMAREARRSEARAGKEEVEDDDDDDEIGEQSAASRHRVGIENAIGARLTKLRKKLNSVPEGLPGLLVNYLGMSGKGEDKSSRDSSDLKEANRANETLMFKKRSKFRSPSMKRSDSPKGFGGTRVGSAKSGDSGSAGTSNENGSVGDNGSELLDLEMQVGQQRSDYREDGKSDLGRERGTQHSQRFANGKQGITTTSDKQAVSNINGSLKHRELGEKTPANKSRERQPTVTDIWWLSLPYVLVIVMRRGSDREQDRLYSLKISSQAQEQRSSSYIVAFEDHADANNFCFLLESFFEDLGEFSADIIPLPIKELHEAVKVNSMKVIVVKKRQLQLYAGQPFADVEMALQSLVKGD